MSIACVTVCVDVKDQECDASLCIIEQEIFTQCGCGVTVGQGCTAFALHGGHPKTCMQ